MDDWFWFRLQYISFSYQWQMPAEVGYWTHLQAVLFFVVCPIWGGSIQGLECLNELRGEIAVLNLGFVTGKE